MVWTDLFGTKPNQTVNPDEVVAVGAASGYESPCSPIFSPENDVTANSSLAELVEDVLKDLSEFPSQQLPLS